MFFPFFLSGLFCVPIFILMASQCLAIRQKAAIEQLNIIITEMEMQTNQRRGRGINSQLTSLFFSQFLHTEQSTLSLCSDIGRVSNCWSWSLTAFFAGFIAIQCYTAYVAFLVKKLPLFGRVFMLYGLLEMQLVQFALLHQCAKVATNGDRMERLNRRLYQTLFLSRTAGFGGPVNRLFLLKVLPFSCRLIIFKF